MGLVIRGPLIVLAVASLTIGAVPQAGPQQSPVVGTNDATFVVPGTLADPPRIVGDFNGWAGGAMTPSADGRVFTLRVPLDPAARIEYLVAYRDRFALDPGNPRTVPAPAGPPRSELVMPAYHPPPPQAEPRTRGTVEDVPFVSRAGERRRVRVYVPANPESRPANPESRIPIPVLYVHDGEVVLDKLQLPALLDSLIETRQIAPAIVVFIDAVDRHEDYDIGSPFRHAFVNEIVPSIERRYGITAGRRALMGLSRSTLGAMDTCVNGGIGFEACILVAPAIAPAQLITIVPPERAQTRFVIAAGTYDIPLVDDARALRDELRRRRLSVRYSELPQGHNHTAFRAALPDALRHVFPAQ